MNGFAVSRAWFELVWDEQWRVIVVETDIDLSEPDLPVAMLTTASLAMLPGAPVIATGIRLVPRSR